MDRGANGTPDEPLLARAMVELVGVAGAVGGDRSDRWNFGVDGLADLRAFREVASMAEPAQQYSS